MHVTYIDHYDSFTYNVIDWLLGIHCIDQVELIAFDDPNLFKRLENLPGPIVLSPGPKHPDDALPSQAVVEKYAGRRPILGICLGLQIMARATGLDIQRSVKPWHGSARNILKTPESVGLNNYFRRLPDQFLAATYNSLCVSGLLSHSDWQCIFRNNFGEIEGLFRPPSSQKAALLGLQFHPESFLSECREIWQQTLNEFFLGYPALKFGDGTFTNTLEAADSNATL